MTKSARLVVGIVGVLAFLALLALVVVKFVFTKERVLAMLTPQLERVIDRPVTIADAGITLWGGIGVRLDGVTVGNAAGFSREPMLSLQRLDIKARFWPLLRGHVVIDRIVLDQPYALIELSEDGRSNFAGMIKTDAAPDSGMAPADGQPLKVARIIIVDAGLGWRDRRDALWIDLFGADAEINLDAARPGFLAFDAQTVFDSLFLQGHRRFSIRAGQPSLAVRGSWDRTSRTLTVDSAATEWWGARINAAGRVQILPSLYDVAFNARLGAVRVEELIREIDAAFPLPKLAGLTARMSGDIEARFVWPLPDNTAPEWQGRFEVTDLRWPLPETGVEVAIPRVQLHGSDRSVSWSVAAGQITGGTFATSGTIDRLFLTEPTFSALLKADVPLEGMKGLLPAAWRSSIAGAVRIDLNGFGQLDDWRNLHVTGEVASDRLRIVDADWDFDSLVISADCRLTGHGVQLDRCDWTAGASRGQLNGQIESLLPAVLNDYATPDVPHGRIDVSGPRIDLDALIGDETSAPDTLTGDPEKIPLMSISGTLRADTVIYNGLLLTAIEAPYEYRDRVLSLAPIRGELYGGLLGGRLDWNLNSWPAPEFFASLSADNIEAEAFAARYLGWVGGVSGLMTVSGEFNGRGREAEQILPTLIAQGKVDLSGARLEAAPLLGRIGAALGISGLDRPRSLRDLRVPFRIENGRIITDELRVTFDDVQYTARGSYGLDHSLHYSVSARAVGANAPRLIPETGLRFSLTGTVTAPEVRIDAAGTARDVVDDLVGRAKDTLQKRFDEKLRDLFKPQKP
ncbi:MAG TPA: AsmA family protein [bacterium]|nr:AsmA family protein [bacterium]